MHLNAAVVAHDPSLAILAHELREPLASILFAVQSVDEATCNDPANREMWGIVERQSRYLARIIDQVLELSRRSHDKLRLNKDWFDLGLAMTDAVETVRPLLTQRRHRLSISVPPAPVYVVADAVRLRQVVINLLTNAAKYTEPGGRIELGLAVEADAVHIEVRDNGAGIAPELLPRVFDLFRQGGERGQGAFSGLGIGLALVKFLVELHGGSVTARSRGAGLGSAFLVRLPGVNPRVGPAFADTCAAPRVPQPARVWAADAMSDA